MNNKQEITNFEFLLSLDGNIICQRLFNVKNHNPDARRSMDLHYYVKEICSELAESLKIKSSDFLCENQNYLSNIEFVGDSNDKKNEDFLLELKLGDEVFIQRIFPAGVYHPKVRYTVDIRPKIKSILHELTEILSSDDLETVYLEHDLL